MTRISGRYAALSGEEIATLKRLGCNTIAYIRATTYVYLDHILAVYFLNGLQEVGHLTMISPCLNLYTRTWGQCVLDKYIIKPFDFEEYPLNSIVNII